MEMGNNQLDSSSSYISFFQGVEGSACVLSFATESYRKSVNCQKELTYASQLKKPILPVLIEDLDMEAGE